MMEKDKQQSKVKNKFLKKAAAAITVTFQNGPFSPGRDHRFRSDNNANRWGAKTHAAPIVTMIPYEARRKPKDASNSNETQEPTSPKISCMGQIKHHKKKHIPVSTSQSDAASTPKDTDAKKSKLQRIFSYRSKSKFAERKSDGFVNEGNKAPPMGDMRRFASGRETFSNFNWKAMIEAEEIDQRDCFTDTEEDEILIPFSAPILVGDGDGDGGTTTNVPNLQFKPRNETNLWKRRTMAPPRPLQLNPVLKAK